jgi:hypothetical protein
MEVISPRYSPPQQEKKGARSCERVWERKKQADLLDVPDFCISNTIWRRDSPLITKGYNPQPRAVNIVLDR